VYGAGGHGRAVAEVIRRQGRYRIACVLDDHQQPPDVLGAAWIGGAEKLASLHQNGIHDGFIAIGDNAARARVTAGASAAGFELVTVIDPSAIVASDARVGAGTALMPMSYAGASARVGRGSIVNTCATVDHDCVLGDFAHISAGVHMTGGCLIGDFAFVGVSASFGRPVTVGEGTIIGAGAVVLVDLPAHVVAAGVPARVLRTLDHDLESALMPVAVRPRPPDAIGAAGVDD
jgi:sugar O-acyltransferase (sialic acid O-acetyltransferase NeuD family)